MKKRVFVTGCFDMLHSGHIAFFKEASFYGDLYVGIGSDATVRELKGRNTINSEQERLYMVKSIRYVTDAFINTGKGFLDFEDDLKKIKPDVFIVNEDGFSPAKQQLCSQLGIELKILKRVPEMGLPAQSTTNIMNAGFCSLPYRIDLAGTWIDQPFVSKFHPGWALTLSLEPIIEYNERCGMASSTRNVAKNIWPQNLPLENPEKLAKNLFCLENEPGTKFIAGAQDSIGICFPGLTRHFYDGKYWPLKIESVHYENVLQWLENHLQILLLWPRPEKLDLLQKTYINRTNVKQLAESADKCWQAIVDTNLEEFGNAFLDSFLAQTKMFPAMINKDIEKIINQYKAKALAWKLAGAGGGGYLLLVSEKPIEGTMKIRIRRKEFSL